MMIEEREDLEDRPPWGPPTTTENPTRKMAIDPPEGAPIEEREEIALEHPVVLKELVLTTRVKLVAILEDQELLTKM